MRLKPVHVLEGDDVCTGTFRLPNGELVESFAGDFRSPEGVDYPSFCAVASTVAYINQSSVRTACLLLLALACGLVAVLPASRRR